MELAIAWRRANSRCGGRRSPGPSRPDAISSATVSATDRKSFTGFTSLVGRIETHHCTECNVPY
ncbi:hypothetical protein SBADM41S_09221 [Streptomyces badius]